MSDEEMTDHLGRLDRLDRDPGRIRELHPLLLKELREDQDGPIRAVPTCLPTWNEASRAKGGGEGLASGWLVYVAGHTGAGKTLFTLNQVRAALRADVSVLYFTLELDWEHIATRLRGIVSGRDVTHLEWGSEFDPGEAEAADRGIADLPGSLFVNTEPIWKLEDVQAVVEEYAWKYDVGLVVIDYAQLIDPRGSNRHLSERMTEVSRSLSLTAQECSLTGLVVSQANRASTRDRETTPTVDSLFGSSRLGQDADQVVILDWTRQENLPSERKLRTWALLAKNNHGPEVEIPVELDKSTLRFREAKRDEEDCWP